MLEERAKTQLLQVVSAEPDGLGDERRKLESPEGLSQELREVDLVHEVPLQGLALAVPLALQLPVIPRQPQPLEALSQKSLPRMPLVELRGNLILRIPHLEPLDSGPPSSKDYLPFEEKDLSVGSSTHYVLPERPYQELEQNKPPGLSGHQLRLDTPVVELHDHPPQVPCCQMPVHLLPIGHTDPTHPGSNDLSRSCLPSPLCPQVHGDSTVSPLLTELEPCCQDSLLYECVPSLSSGRENLTEVDLFSETRYPEFLEVLGSLGLPHLELDGI